jgi:hypothetical protein
MVLCTRESQQKMVNQEEVEASSSSLKTLAHRFNNALHKIILWFWHACQSNKSFMHAPGKKMYYAFFKK